MTDLNERNRSFYRCTVFFRELFQQGVRHIVISPGSRSTPLTLAAAAHPGLEKHVILDERSAAFTAMGIGKATGVPAVLICTSGTAAANYYPAVIEAYQSGVPLLLATSDRPPELRNTDANQTIDQLDLFGKFVIYFKNIEEPAGTPLELNEITESAGNAFEEAVKLQGPVHLNFPFGKPLEPKIEFVRSVKKENETYAKKTKMHLVGMPSSTMKPENKIFQKLKTAKRPLVIIGQIPASCKIEPVFKLAERLNAPILSESGNTDEGNSIQGYEGFLRNEQTLRQLSPDLILRFGLQPAGKSLLLALDEWSPKHHIYVKHLANKKETSLPVTDTLNWNGEEFILENMSGSHKLWMEQWENAEKNYQDLRENSFRKIQVLTDGHVYEHFSEQIPESWWMFFSNSFPVRDRSMFGKWQKQQVFTNRGASGIDGITSTAMGISLAKEKPGILFTGDLAFLHDTNALLNRKKLNNPLIVVVINNNGGSIFRMLPIAEHKEYFTDYFETPQQVDISHLCKSYGAGYQKIGNIEALKNFNLDNFIGNSGSLLNIVECKTDPDASMQLRKKLWKLEI